MFQVGQSHSFKLFLARVQNILSQICAHWGSKLLISSLPSCRNRLTLKRNGIGPMHEHDKDDNGVNARRLLRALASRQQPRKNSNSSTVALDLSYD